MDKETRVEELWRLINYAEDKIARQEHKIRDLLDELNEIEGNPTVCIDCGIDAWYFDERDTGNLVHEDFYVHDELWWKIVPTDGVICIGCFETRAGRRLEPEDFKTNGAYRLFGLSPSLRFLDRAGGWNHNRTAIPAPADSAV